MSDANNVERSHVPSEEELSKEVSDVVLEMRDPAPSSSVVFEEILKRRAQWNVSEEQVAKYVDDAEYSEVVEDMDEDTKKGLEKSPPRRPQRTMSTDSVELTEEVMEIVNMDDEAIVEEADKRSSFILKGGSHSIQKVLRGTAREKKETGPSRFDRRKMRLPGKANALDSSNQDAHQGEDPSASQQEEAAGAADDEVEVVVDDKVLEALHGSYNEPLETGSELEFEQEVERRSKFIARGGMHSIKKVLDGNARSAGRSGQPRFDRRRIARNESTDDDDDGQALEDDDASPSGDTPPMPVNSRPVTRQVSVDSTDSFIENEANRRANFMVKGASHSIIKILEGRTTREPTVNRFDRRKTHFKKESEAVHYTETPHATPQEMNEARMKDESDRRAAREARKQEKAGRAAPRQPRRHQSLKDDVEPENEAGEDDEDLEREADRRSKYMVKGGSHSIRKLFAGSAKKTQGINRFDRRKMHFKKESEAVDYAEKSHLKPDEINKRHQEEAARLRGENGDEDDEDCASDEDEELLAEADSRSMMMLKGASHSIRNIFAGKSKSKKQSEDTGMNRRLSHFKKDEDKGEASTDDRKTASEPFRAETAEDEKPDVSPKHKPAGHAGRFSLRGARGSIKTMLGMKGSKKTTMDEEIARLRGDQGSGEQLGDEEDDDNQEEEVADEDREIEDEVDRRSSFMAKGASYSIQKVLTGKARQKKETITRFDRRKMHFKHEAEAIHSHDEDPKSHAPAHHHRDSIVGGDSGDECNNDEDDDDEDREIEEEADKRSAFMAKGASYSIQKVLTGKARQKKDGITRFDRRKMHFKHESEAIHSHDQPSIDNAAMPKKRRDSIAGGDTDDDMDEEDRELEEEADKRSAFMAKGASYSIQKVLAGKHRKPKTETVTRFDRRKMHFKKDDAAGSKDSVDTNPKSLTPRVPQRKLSDDAPVDDADGETKSKSPSASGFTSAETSLASTGTKDPEVTDDTAEDDPEEDVDLRKRFSLKGASHSIKKVLAGKARRSTTTGVTPTRFDRRKMHFKKPGNKDEGAES